MNIIENLNFEYIVDDKKKIVVATITNKIINIALSNTADISGLVLENIQIKECKGVAKCCPEDTYNETLGMKIAKKKALKKFFTQIKGVVQESIANQEKLLNSIYLTSFDVNRKLDGLDASINHYKKVKNEAA